MVTFALYMDHNKRVLKMLDIVENSLEIVRVFAFLLVCSYKRKEMQSDVVPKCGQMSRLMCAKTSL